MSGDSDPWKNFPGGNPFGPGGPFHGQNPFGGGDPFANMDQWLRSMGIDPGEFRSLFDDMQKNLQDAFKDLGQDPSKGFVAGFNVRMGPDGKPTINRFGSKPTIKTDGAMPTIGSDQREPLTDVIESADSVAVTMELPGVEKKDIDINMSAERLEITVDNDSRRYHKSVKLPAKVDPATTKATYTNGILDVLVSKIARDDGGVRIQVE